jgi:hypothetical protein
MIFHRHSTFNLEFPKRVCFEQGRSAEKTDPQDAAAAAEKQKELQEKQLALTKLVNELEIATNAAKLLDLAEEKDVDTGSWKSDPRSALDFLKDYGKANPKINDKLNKVGEMLSKPLLDSATGKQDEESKMAEEFVLALGRNIEMRRAELKKVHGELRDVRESSENALNQKVFNFAENAYDTYGRMSVPEKLGTVGALLLFIKMAFSKENTDKEANSVIRPLLFGFAALLGGNAVMQDFTGKSLTDWAGEKLGLERFMPMAKDQLPVAMQSLAVATKTDMPSELHAMAKLAYVKMSDIPYNPSKDSIDPTIFGLKEKKTDGLGEPGEISGKQLFTVIDAIMKKPAVEVMENGKKKKYGTGKEFVEAHPDYDFATVVYWLYEKEAIAAVSASMPDADRVKYVKEVRDDMETTFQNLPAANNARVKVHPRSGNVSFFGVTFLTERKKDKDESNHQYVFHLGDDERVSMRLKDGEMAKAATLDLLRESAKRYLEEKHVVFLRTFFPNNFGTAKLEFYDQTAAGGSSMGGTRIADRSWHLTGVKLESAKRGKNDLFRGDGATTVTFRLYESDLGHDTSSMMLEREGGKKIVSSTKYSDFNRDILYP